ncbi:unnamed protein product [Gongylonema pulchrum]|uniref:Beta-lactamase domain-containing protein n=1 Tax=Gongylonema pulchrum TaxID=637853 RepID=A0A183D7J1_9BILA|nr:unnamed protein product [Gongylonema pulchrum]
MSKILESQKPNWTPGQGVGYHAMTFGWLVDQLVRRIDPKKRSLAQFFKEEIAQPHGKSFTFRALLHKINDVHNVQKCLKNANVDLIIGAPVELEYRIARLASEPKLLAAREILEYPALLKMVWNAMYASVATGDRLLGKMHQNYAWMGSGALKFNNPEIRSLEMPAATGMSTARALAKLHSLLVEGKLLKQSTTERLCSTPPVLNQPDLVISQPVSFGRGFWYSKNPQVVNQRNQYFRIFISVQNFFLFISTW